VEHRLWSCRLEKTDLAERKGQSGRSPGEKELPQEKAILKRCCSRKREKADAKLWEDGEERSKGLLNPRTEKKGGEKEGETLLGMRGKCSQREEIARRGARLQKSESDKQRKKGGQRQAFHYLNQRVVIGKGTEGGGEPCNGPSSN